MLTLVTEGKKRYLPLLLLGDEQESMIDRYLEEGALYIWKEGEETAGVCVVTDQGNGVLELKNIAVDPRFQRRGIGRAMIEALAKRSRGSPFHPGLLPTLRLYLFPPGEGFFPAIRPPHCGRRGAAKGYGVLSANIRTIKNGGTFSRLRRCALFQWVFSDVLRSRVRRRCDLPRGHGRGGRSEHWGQRPAVPAESPPLPGRRCR